MSNGAENKNESSIISDQYDDHRQLAEETMKSDSKKACIMLIVTAIVVFGFDMLAVYSSDVPFSLVWLNIIPVPIGLIGLGLLAIKEPMVAVVIAALLVFALWIFNLVPLSPVVIEKGLTQKGIAIGLLFGAYMFANCAMKEKQDLTTK